MPRRIPSGRFDDLIRQATEVFIARGWRRTQMADIAEAVGVSKPTLYLYVQSKEALFALCCRYADAPAALSLPSSLPVATPPDGTALEQLAKRLELAAALPQLAIAAASERADDIEAELRSVVEELYTTCEENCRTLKLLDRCWDHPEFGPAWVQEGRVAPRLKLADYLAARVRAGQLPAHASPRLLARIALETVVTWAMHIKWDRAPEVFDPQEAKHAVVDFVVRALLLGSAPDAANSRPSASEEDKP
jgi:AcrR family transcriptional regulator